jgi:hypothetical protein
MRSDVGEKGCLDRDAVVRKELCIMTQVRTWSTVVSLALLAGLVLPGCMGAASLPNEVSVTLPDGSQVSAKVGSGPASLANSEWLVYRGTAGTGNPFVRLVFDEDGGIERFEENSISPEIFGSTIHLDGARHNTTQQGLTYVGGVYGAETADGTGIGFEARIVGFAAGLRAASANASVSATFDDGARDTIRGTFSYKSEVTLINLPEGNQEDSFEFVGRRATAE